MSDRPHHLLAKPLDYQITETQLCDREMEAHLTRVLEHVAAVQEGGPAPTLMATLTAAQVHATAALAWATRGARPDKWGPL